jgi:hypothetical protein
MSRTKRVLYLTGSVVAAVALAAWLDSRLTRSQFMVVFTLIALAGIVFEVLLQARNNTK